ncbi:hypothetical protein [Actinoallomurus rhizosphaericola]|uniref:hypothetical protein n=1 Tax=Actinoallomurus rhizosphaericola TaxID=2952536 RepID=UPI002091845D|nr:hypothetical protein [Actinoallomurus rhizosphaericola]MCO5992822.1 hypothetical protein [Actinoallomurus rhizosphaericola]
MSRSPSPLPAISASWIGGNIQGLSGLSQVLYNFAENSKDPVSVLNRTVARLVRESGERVYPGSAVGAFRDQFGQDSEDIGWLSQRAISIGDIVDGLAVNLAKIESWLERQAEKGVAAGYVVIDHAGNMSFPHGTSKPEVQKFIQEFAQCREQALAAASKARQVAARKLSSEYKALAAGLKNYRDNHKDLLSQNEVNSLAKSYSLLEANDKKADKLLRHHSPTLHWGAGVKGAWAGASTVGGTVALFATETGPFDPAIAGAAAAVAGTVGFVKGVVTGNGDPTDW